MLSNFKICPKINTINICYTSVQLVLVKVDNEHTLILQKIIEIVLTTGDFNINDKNLQKRE